MNEPFQLTLNQITVCLENTFAQEFLAPAGPVTAGSVDLVLTDPPYIISRESGFRKTDVDGKFIGGSKFAVHTDFGDWDNESSFTMADLNASVIGMHRALRPGGVAIVFFDIWKVSHLARMMKNAGFANVAMIEWKKTNAVPINSRKNYLSNAREIAVVGHKADGIVIHRTENYKGAFSYPIYASKDRFHPTQKSLPMFEDLVAAHTNPGDLVMDCFSGSATTGAAAIRTGRSYIGCEPDAEFFAKSAERLVSEAIQKTSKKQT